MKLPDAHKSNKVTGDRHLLPSVDMGAKDKHSLVAASNLQKKTGVSLSLTNLALTFDLEAEDEYAVRIILFIRLILLQKVRKMVLTVDIKSTF